METIGSQTQGDLLYKGLETFAEARRNETDLIGERARTMLEVLAEAAMAQATQSMLALQDEDTVDTTRNLRVRKLPKTRATRYCNR